MTKRKGCLFWALVVVAAGVVVLVLLGILVTRAVEEKVTSITDVQPMSMPTPPRSPDRRMALVARVEAFLAHIDAGESARLELTGDDINMLISHYTPVEQQGWRVHVNIDGSTVKVRASVPIASLIDVTPFPFDGVGDRYLNGTFDFGVSMQEGVLNVRLLDLDLGGREIDEEVRAEIEKQNLAEEVDQSPAGEWVGKLNTIEVRNGVMILER